MKPFNLQLTWAGFDAAVDLIVAQCCRSDVDCVYAPSSSGLMLAIPVADRLKLPLSDTPQDNMLLLEGHAWDCALSCYASRYKNAQPWVWLDTTLDGIYNSVVKMPSVKPVCVAMPWQDAMIDCCNELFIPGFHD
jgi:hypothetical protein